jgi:hypothetical protein
MQWWNGKLYVGTNRAFLCAERAAIHNGLPLLRWFPLAKYPPADPDAGCTPDMHDLPLQAEIWRWTPETDTWERVYQSPRDVPIPGKRGRHVARDVGFRDMAVFVEPDGREALYVSGVSSRFIYHHVPSARLLRSLDGESFEPVPQQPGTCLGDLKTGSLRTIVSYKGRLFVIAGEIRGDGIILEASHPARGNDHFRQVTPPGMAVFEMIPFNGYLYVGVRDTKGYAVLKTDATGTPPYTFTPVVTHGAYLPRPSYMVISMQVYQGRLYVGTDRPAELIRINPDDTWDLVAGTPRETPNGWKYPLSGLEAGFYSWLNGHIWRMLPHDGRLYIGTMKQSTHFRNVAGVEQALRPNYGFDLFETADGWHYTPVTLDGFGDMFAFGVRSLASTPYGLFLGTANSWYGLQIWRGTPEGAGPGGLGCRRPELLEAEYVEGRIVLSWDPSPGARRFHIWRAEITDQRPAVDANRFFTVARLIARNVRHFVPNAEIPPLPDQMWVPGPFQEIGAANGWYYVDEKSVPDRRYRYYVQAEDEMGNRSGPSNLVAVPPLFPPVTFQGLLDMLDQRVASNKLLALEDVWTIRDELNQAWARFQAGDATGAKDMLTELSDRLAQMPPVRRGIPSPLKSPRAGEGIALTYLGDFSEALQEENSLDRVLLEDFQVLLLKLRRRVALSLVPSFQGLICP